MNPLQEIENKFIVSLGKQLMEDMTVNIMNVQDKSMTVSTIRSKWVMQYFKEKEYLQKLKRVKSKLVDTEIDNLQTTNTQYRNISRIRLENQVCKDNIKISKMDKMIKDQQEVIKFMEYALNIVSDFNFTIKHALESLKMNKPNGDSLCIERYG